MMPTMELGSFPGQRPMFNVVLAKGLGDHMYYRQPNGFLTASPIGKANSRMHSYMNQGWEPLRKYGRFDFLPQYADAPFEVLLMRGGAVEFSLDHLKAMGWHLNPPILPNCGVQLGALHQQQMGSPQHIHEHCIEGAQPAVFPQLATLTFDPVPGCEFCDRTIFASEKQRFQHMRVLHKEELQQISAAREMAKGISSALSGLAATAVLPPKLPFACGLCDESFEKVTLLGAHVKLHDDDQATPAS